MTDSWQLPGDSYREGEAFREGEAPAEPRQIGGGEGERGRGRELDVASRPISLSPALPLSNRLDARPALSAASSWDAWFERAGERLNPILVKEARQALKSRQFVATFFLVLICCWGWSVAGVALMSPSIFWAPRGAEMLAGYFWILNFPLCVVVPVQAFRSLGSEIEDGTHALVAITTLSPRRIVLGKIGAAGLQMLVYLSALAPGVAFTYLLGGVDILFIGLLLGYALAASLLLSMAGLLLATLSTERHFQMVLMLLFTVAVGGLFLASGVVAVEMLNEGPLPFEDGNFWLAVAAVATVALGLFALLFFAAAARISFESDNRASPLRVAMLLLHADLLAWLGLLWLRVGDDGVFYFLLAVMGVYWGALGIFLVCERPEMSRRVRRDLPRSFSARLFLTWFNPGPGSGYVFAVANLTTAFLLAWAGVWYLRLNGLSGAPDVKGWGFGLLLGAYVVLYLGVGRLLVALTRRKYGPNLFRDVLAQAILLFLYVLVPVIAQISLTGGQGGDYTALQAPNFLWTLAVAMDFGVFAPRFNGQIAVTFWLVVPAAALVLLANLIVNRRELAQAPRATPRRVRDDDAELAARARPRRGPWDE